MRLARLRDILLGRCLPWMIGGPIAVIGPEGSGTNLLTRLIGSQPQMRGMVCRSWMGDHRHMSEGNIYHVSFPSAGYWCGEQLRDVPCVGILRVDADAMASVVRRWPHRADTIAADHARARELTRDYARTIVRYEDVCDDPQRELAQIWRAMRWFRIDEPIRMGVGHVG